MGGRQNSCNCKILQARIIVHQAYCQSPQEAEYDAWPELIELVHEPVNAGLGDKFHR